MVVQLYTWITFPIYYFSQRAWEKRAKSERVRVKIIEPGPTFDPNDILSDEEKEEQQLMSATYVRSDTIRRKHDIVHLHSVTEMLDQVVKVYGSSTLALGKLKRNENIIAN